MMKSKYLWLPFLAPLLFLISCQSDDTVCDPSVVSFDIDYFIEELNTEFQTDLAGYQIAVNQGGNLYYNKAFGFARYKDDPGGEVLMTENTRQNIASVSKFVATIALMKAMETTGIDPEDNVVDHLPDSWLPVIHPDFSDPLNDAYLTFSKLFTMNTAIDFIGSIPPSGSMLSEQDMLISLRREPNLDRIGTYQNATFTLVRVLIGEIVYDLDEEAGDYSIVCTEKYFEYLRETIFDPLEIDAPLTPQAVLDYYNTSDYPLGYTWPFDPTPINNNGFIGWEHKNNPLNAGSSGLLLSAQDLAKMLALFKYDNQGLIISSTQRDKIFNGTEDYGPFGLTSTLMNREHGTYYAKNGAKSNDCCSRALRSVVMFFPNDVEVALLINFNRRIPRLRLTIADIYEDSYRSGCN